MVEKTDYGENVALPLWLFHQGTNYTLYDFLGVKRVADENMKAYGYIFRVWAPGADHVSLTGDFTGWGEGIAMEKIPGSGVWEVCLKSDESLEGKFYKFAVNRYGNTCLKADPCARRSQSGASAASVICTETQFSWSDDAWLRSRGKWAQKTGRRKKKYYWSAPMNIYEMHLGSWHTREDGCTADGAHYLNYREIADRLAPYLTDMGYTHVELMPILEHPYDGSWGYQVCGYFAPTARFGSPDDFRYFVNTMHSAGIGVILDWVPAHFPKDAHGLYEFDGAPLYEYQREDRREHAGWGTRYFDVGRAEVQSFLISNALYWMREYHADGLRADAVASMLYLDFDRKPGEWTPNSEGGNQNTDAVLFFQKLNSAVFSEFPHALMIAEESSDWPMITKPVYDGGLGFNFKWNMGWANDLFSYVSADPIFRREMHTKLTFPMMYAFSENYILPISHDEVVHGKKSLIGKMFGEYEEKFAAMRTFLLYMMTLPGKKLMFMGTEFAQFREWDYENSLEWFMTDYPKHGEMQHFVRTLNRFYLTHPPLWEIEDSWDGFVWLEADNADENILAYSRVDTHGRELIVILNFCPVRRDAHTLRVLKKGVYREAVNTDSIEFGGKGVQNTEVETKTVKQEDGTRVNLLTVVLPAQGGLVLERISPQKKAEMNDRQR